MTADPPPLVQPPSALRATLGGAYYASPDVFAAEQERIFEAMWFCATRSSDLALPGRFKKVQIGSESVLLVRGRDGLLRAFLNICRHRGAQLCTEAEGQVRRSLRCPYHSWTYALDGRLTAAPNIGGALTDDAGALIDRYEFGLVPVALTEWLATPGCAWPKPHRPSRRWWWRRPGRSATRTPSTGTGSAA